MVEIAQYLLFAKRLLSGRPAPQLLLQIVFVDPGVDSELLVPRFGLFSVLVLVSLLEEEYFRAVWVSEGQVSL